MTLAQLRFDPNVKEWNQYSNWWCKI